MSDMISLGAMGHVISWRDKSAIRNWCHVVHSKVGSHVGLLEVVEATLCTLSKGGVRPETLVKVSE